ncbi:MAG: FecR family protein [Bacteriovorax sp.]|jgi:hypothetical protein
MKKLIVLVLLAVGAFFFAQPYMPKKQDKENNKTVALTFLKVVGKVSVSSNGKTQDAIQGLALDSNFTVKTENKSYAILGFGKDFSSKIKIGSNGHFNLTRFNLNQNDVEPRLDFNLKSGELLMKIFNPSKKEILKVYTNLISMGIRGTTFLVKSDQDRSLLVVQEGAVAFENESNKSGLAESNTAYLVSSSGTIQKVPVSNYNINWDLEGESDNLITQNISAFGERLENAAIEMKNQVIKINSEVDSVKAEIAELNKEFLAIDNDLKCVKPGAGECYFSSKPLKEEVYGRGKSEDERNRFKEKLEKYSEELKQEKTKLEQSKDAQTQNLVFLETKYKKTLAGIEKMNSNEEILSNSEKRIAAYKEIVDIIDDENLRLDFEDL